MELVGLPDRVQKPLSALLKSEFGIACAVDESTPSSEEQAQACQLACIWADNEQAAELLASRSRAIVLAERISTERHCEFVREGALCVYDLAYTSLESLASLISAHLQIGPANGILRESPIQGASTHFALLEWDNSFRITRWSDEAESLLGISKEQAYATPLDQSLIHESERAPFLEQCQALASGALPEFKGRWRITRADGSSIESNWKVIPRDAKNESFIGIFEVAGTEDDAALPYQRNDDREQASPSGEPSLVGEPEASHPFEDPKAEYLSRAVEYLSIGVYVTDETRSSTFTVWNKQMERLFQKSKSEVIGRPLRQVFADPLLRSVLSEASSPHSRNRAILPKFSHDGSRSSNFIADVNKSLLLDAKERVVSIVGVVHDVTDRIQSENRLVSAFNELEASKEKLEQSNLEIRKGIEKAKKLAVAAQSSNKAKSFLLSNISHELRTPLNSIVSLTHALMEGTFGPLNPKQTENLEIVADSARHLQSLITDILDLSKIELGKMNLKIAKTNVSEIAHSSIRMVEQQAALKRVTCVLEVNARTETIDADSKRLRQILLNLLVNAVKFTRPQTQVTLSIDESASGESIRFAVKDHGIGIQESDFHRIFSPFTQLDDSLSRQYEGTGLGLAIVSKFVELHGGGLHVQSRPNLGTTFTIELPTSIVDPPEEAAKEPPLAEFALSSAQSENLVLIVDENERVAHALKQTAKLFPDLTPILAMPNEISAYHDQIAPKAIFVDLGTLANHGSDWMLRARDLAAWKDTRWIAISSLDIHANQQTAEKHAFHQFRCKPVSQSVFKNLLLPA